MSQATAAFNPYHITRPNKALRNYYLVCALLTGPAFPLVFLPLFLKYETLRYRFDADGVAMTWGFFFRKEIYLTYRRIQDIHLTRNIIQRFMNLATVSVQTASGTAGAEMSIDGILEADDLRDFLYHQMRGAKGLEDETTPAALAAGATLGQTPPADEALSLLRDIRDQLAQAAVKAGNRS